jgi:hypothetical protein
MPFFGSNISSLASWACPTPHGSLKANTFKMVLEEVGQSSIDNEKLYNLLTHLVSV